MIKNKILTWVNLFIMAIYTIPVAYSIWFIGIFAKFFIKNRLNRMMGALSGAVVFYVVTNFGVWSLGSYGYTAEGLMMCYTLALPFFGYTLVSTIIFSFIIEFVYQFLLLRQFKSKKI